MERATRIAEWRRYLLFTLFALCCWDIHAQQVDLHSYTYYRLYETAEEAAMMEADSISTIEFNQLRSSAIQRLSYNRAMFSTNRGVAFYRRITTLNGVELPYISNSSIWKLHLSQQQYDGMSDRGLSGELRLQIDSIDRVESDVRVLFRSRNMPYAISASTSHRFKRGWSLAATVTARTGRDLFIDGLYGNSLDIKALATKEFSPNRHLSIALFLSPTMRSVRSLSTAEAFRLLGNNLYNPAWGYQNGKVRSARVRREIIPTLVGVYDDIISETTRLSITASIASGIKRYSSLDWFGVQTPIPDNYHYLPSYFSDEDDIFSAVEMAWLCNDTRYTQIDFDNLIKSNKLSNGEALYAISDRVERVIHTALRASFSTKLERGNLSYGVDISISNNRKYKQMQDLLGADHIVDLDHFLLDDATYSNSLQNNLESPSRLIYEGDRFSYDYAMRRYDAMAYAAYHYTGGAFSLNASAQVGYTNISRRGFYRKELFADNSFGGSRQAKFTPYALYIDGAYTISRNHLLSAKIIAEAKACDAEDLFLQSQYNNRMVDNPTMRQGYGAEVNYLLSLPKIAVCATLFGYATLNDRAVEHRYDDLSGEYADIVISNLDIIRYGLAVRANYQFARNFSAVADLCVGRYKYIDNGVVTTYSDAANTLITHNAASHIRNLSLGNAPQVTLMAGLSYRNRGWFASVKANYQGLRYVEPSIAMRTERILVLASSPEERIAMSQQERLRDAFTLDISLSKSLYLNKLYRRVYRTKWDSPTIGERSCPRIIFAIAIRNLIGSSNTVDTGVESSRIQVHRTQYGTYYSRQASRYLYAYPRTYEASVSFRF